MTAKSPDPWIEKDQGENDAREVSIVLLVWIVSLGAVVAGLCGLALWLLPDAPPWAVKLVVLCGSMATACLGFLKVRAEGQGILGILKSEPVGKED